MKKHEVVHDGKNNTWRYRDKTIEMASHFDCPVYAVLDGEGGAHYSGETLQECCTDIDEGIEDEVTA